MKIIFLSIEFSIGTFSGNGIYAISQVRALRQLGHEVLVICGRPEATPTVSQVTDSSKDLLSIPLPVWNRLDIECSWKEYALGCGAPSIVKSVVNFEADVVLGVDWHSYAAYQNLVDALQAEEILNSCSSPLLSRLKIPPYACSNYRVYLRSLPQNNNNATEVNLIRKLESDSLLCGICSFVLSQSDKKFVEENYYYNTNTKECLKESEKKGNEIEQDQLQPPPPPRPPPPLHVILPALRADLAALPLPLSQRRKYLLCCVRASPEKEPHRFIDLICELQRRNIFENFGIVPLLVGAGWKIPTLEDGGDIRDGDSASQMNTTTTITTGSQDRNQVQQPRAQESTSSSSKQILSPLENYVLILRQQVESEVPCCQVIETFLGPTEMAEIYAQTVLNIHPPAYDAYGMTIVEAASQLAPSLVAHMGHVGATDLLSPEREEIFVTDMEDAVENVADVVEKLLQNREKLSSVGEKAAMVARAWNEYANAAAVIKILEDSLQIYPVKKENRADLKVDDFLKVKFQKLISKSGGVDVFDAPALSTTSESTKNEKVDKDFDIYKLFEENYLAANKPVIFSGIAKEWRATKEFRRGAMASTGAGDGTGDGEIDIDNIEQKFGTSRVVATDTARRHRGQGTCKEMTVAEYCQWWKERKGERKNVVKHDDRCDDEEYEGKEEVEKPLWYLKDWHFVKDATAISQKMYYHLPMYFSDDWLNEWYDSLSTSSTSSTTAYSTEIQEDFVKLKDDISTNVAPNTNNDHSPPLQPPPLPSTSSPSPSLASPTSSPSSTSDYRFLYLGPQGSSTPLHTDVLHSHSWSANISGRKLWRLLPAEYAHLVQDASTGMSHPYDFYPEESDEKVEKGEEKKTNTIDKYTLQRFPELEQAQKHILEIIQYPGEAIFVPSGWYHTVFNLDDCLSINHNWISSHSVMTSWRYLQKERARAETLIEDCRELNGVAEFEVLVQRNVEANAGLGYAAFGAMVRYIAKKSILEALENENGLKKEGGEEEQEVRQVINFARVPAAEKVLRELLAEQEHVLFLSADGGGNLNDSEQEQAAREALLNEIRLNRESLELIAKRGEVLSTP